MRGDLERGRYLLQGAIIYNEEYVEQYGKYERLLRNLNRRSIPSAMDKAVLHERYSDLLKLNRFWATYPKCAKLLTRQERATIAWRFMKGQLTSVE